MFYSVIALHAVNEMFLTNREQKKGTRRLMIANGVDEPMTTRYLAHI